MYERKATEDGEWTKPRGGGGVFLPPNKRADLGESERKKEYEGTQGPYSREKGLRIKNRLRETIIRMRAGAIRCKVKRAPQSL